MGLDYTLSRHRKLTLPQTNNRLVVERYPSESHVIRKDFAADYPISEVFTMP